MLGSSLLFPLASSSSSFTVLLSKVAFENSSTVLVGLFSVGVVTAESGPGLSDVGGIAAFSC